MRNLKLTLEYDGTDFQGWQIQPKQRTVQGVLQEALRNLLATEVKVIGAGRTDAGVHALNQVANSQADTHLKTEEIRKGANRLLPPDIWVRKVEEVPASFNARRNAVARLYRYTILLTRSPIRKRYAWELKYSLNLRRIRQASTCLCGAHDMTSFSAAGPSKNGRVTVLSCNWRREGDEVCMNVKADRFLRHMVRILVGTLVDVGRGKVAIEEFAGILEARDRTRAGPTAPPQGLCLMDVEY